MLFFDGFVTCWSHRIHCRVFSTNATEACTLTPSMIHIPVDTRAHRTICSALMVRRHWFKWLFNDHHFSHWNRDQFIFTNSATPLKCIAMRLIQMDLIMQSSNGDERMVCSCHLVAWHSKATTWQSKRSTKLIVAFISVRRQTRRQQFPLTPNCLLRMSHQVHLTIWPQTVQTRQSHCAGNQVSINIMLNLNRIFSLWFSFCFFVSRLSASIKRRLHSLVSRIHCLVSSNQCDRMAHDAFAV